MPPSKMDEWFKDRRWRVLTEATGQGFVPPGEVGEHLSVTMEQGHFVVESPGAFKSPLSGNPGRRGIVLQEIDAEDKDIDGSRYPFGEPAVKAARETYGAVI